MKNSKIEKPKFTFITEAREYLSNSMFINQSCIKPDESFKKVLSEETGKKSINDKPFEDLEHILEG